MFSKIYFFFFAVILTLFYTSSVSAQNNVIQGKIVNHYGLPIPKCIIFIKNTDLQTTSDSEGFFKLASKGKGSLIIQTESYLTRIIDLAKIQETNFPLEIILQEKDKNIFTYKNPQDDYALFILNLVRKNKPLTKYKANYYSKGNLQLVSTRETFLGQKRKDLDATLDLSNNNNYIYLGELFSEVIRKDQNHIKEKVIAQTEIGTNKNIFLQTSTDNQLNFYDEKVSNQLKLISPLASYASNYYYFKVTQIDKTSDNKTLYTIKFSPKRDKEPIMEGELTIIDNGWQLTSLYSAMDGENVDMKEIKQIVVNQKYKYNEELDFYVKDSQSIYLKGKFIVFDYTGQFDSYYSNYQKIKNISNKDFNIELIQYEDDFNNKSSAYWDAIRPFPLKNKEIENFKDKTILSSNNTRAVLDSIDKRTNNFTLFKLIKGYEYLNSYENKQYVYRGLLSTFAFNAVQGFNVTTGIDYTKTYDDNRQTKLGTIVNYGVTENKYRVSGYASHLFNKNNYNTITLSGGNSILQFNQDDPVKTPINSFASAWFGKNYAKYFQKSYLKIAYEQYAFTGIKVTSEIEYSSRKTISNHLQSPPFVPHLEFTSNNPLDPNDFESEPFKNNKMFKFGLGLNIIFDQKIISYPDQKLYLPISKYPIIAVKLEKGLNSTTSDYNYTYVGFSTTFNNNISNIGNLYIGLSAGSFLEKNDIAFTDYKHFNGNQTFIGSSSIYNKQFNLLPYYEYSTNKSYIAFHLEHDFRGYLMNKIPLLNKTRYSFVFGFHMLEVPDKNVYQEFSLGLNNFGFGKFRPFRIDYFTSISSDAPKKHGIVIGIKILDMIQK